MPWQTLWHGVEWDRNMYLVAKAACPLPRELLGDSSLFGRAAKAPSVCISLSCSQRPDSVVVTGPADGKETSATKRLSWFWEAPPRRR